MDKPSAPCGDCKYGGLNEGPLSDGTVDELLRKEPLSEASRSLKYAR